MKNKQSKEPTPADVGARLCEDVGLAFRAFFNRIRPPEDARRHFESARLEILKGLRAVLDARIEQRSKRQPRGEQISVE